MLKLLEWTTLVLTTTTILFIVQIFVMRERSARRERKARLFSERWCPILNSCIDGLPSKVPQVKYSDRMNFFEIWSYLHESLLDSAKEGLNSIARRAGMDIVAYQMLRSRNLGERLTAITALGQLKEVNAWSKLLELSKATHPLVSFTSARALMRIDAASALPLLAREIGTRNDWAAPQVAAMLKEADPFVVGETIAQTALDFCAIDPSSAARLVGFLVAVPTELAIPVLRKILALSNDPEVLSATLSLLTSADDLPMIRRLIWHRDAGVRAQALKVLGRIGSAEDERRLLNSLRDPVWVVRYEAAKSFAALPSVTPEKMIYWHRAHDDKFARDMLAQVISEVYGASKHAA
jgi:hypothetical protein